MAINSIDAEDDQFAYRYDTQLLIDRRDKDLSFARKYYSGCYLETRNNMDRAKKFYEKNGFTYTTETLGCTGHGGCDYHYILRF